MQISALSFKELARNFRIFDSVGQLLDISKSLSYTPLKQDV
jgi:hypothetical protein